jgi:gluconokinase
MKLRKNSLVLAFDLGTSSLRTALFDARGRRLMETTAQRIYHVKRAPDGCAELPPQTLWRAARECLAQTLTRRRGDKSLRARPIVAVGASCFWHSLVGADDRGRVLTPIYTWADSRGRDDAARLRRRLSERRVHARTGCMLRASFWPAKLLWLRRTQPRLFARVSHWMSPGEWLQWQFCGRANCGYAMASGTGLFNPTMLDWDNQLLRICRVKRRALNPLDETPLVAVERFHRQFPELRGALWLPALGDGAAGNLGSGATRAGLAAINFGTSGAVRVVRRGRRARAPFGLFCYRVDAGRFLVGGAVSNAGNLHAWALRELKLPDDPRQLERALAARPFPMQGLTVLPFWVSERAPTWPEDMKGAVLGVTQATTALDVLQALREAAFYRLAWIAELMARTSGRRLRFVVSGGLQHSPAGMQRLANVLGSELIVSAEPEASLRGAAVFALEKLGYSIAASSMGRVIRPEPVAAHRYAVARRRYMGLEKRLGTIAALLR